MTELDAHEVVIPSARPQAIEEPETSREQGVYSEQVLEEAKKKAAGLLEEARAAIERERSAAIKTACDEGFKKGYEEGMRRGLDMLADLIKKAEELVGEMSRARQQALQELEPEIVSLACDVAGKIVKKSVEIDPETVLRVTKEAILNAGSEPPVSLRVNPGDLEVISQRLNQLRELCGHDICLQGDDGVSKGGCIVESPAGSVDGTIETQLANIKEQLMEILTTVREETAKAS